MKRLLLFILSILLCGQIFGQLNVKVRKFNHGGANVFDTLFLGPYCFMQVSDSAWIEKPKGTWFASITQGGGATNYIGNNYLKLLGDGTAKNKFVVDLDRGNESAGWYYYWLNTAETWGLYMHLDATGYGFAGLGSEDAWSQIFTIDPVDELDNLYSIAINSATGTNGNFYINNDGAYFQKGIQLNYEEDEATLEEPGCIRYDPSSGSFEGFNGLTTSWTTLSFNDNEYHKKTYQFDWNYTNGNYYQIADLFGKHLIVTSVILKENSQVSSTSGTTILYFLDEGSSGDNYASIIADGTGALELTFETLQTMPRDLNAGDGCSGWVFFGSANDFTAGNVTVWIEYIEY